MNTPRLHLCSLLAASLLLPALAVHAADSRRQWTDSGASFAAGTLGDSGQNLYLNRRGELETIRRYDVDGNGYLDLLFNDTHDSHFALPATLVKAAPGQSLQVSELGVSGSSSVIPCDLNRDGFVDLIFQPNLSNVQMDSVYRATQDMKIAWGAQDGWSASRLTRQLPTNALTALAVGDLNGDDWPDIITLNSEGWLYGQPPGRILRTFWGGPEGFLLTKYQDIGISQAIGVVSGTFGSDRKFCAAVLAANGMVHFLAPDSKGAALHIARTVQLPASGAQPQCLIPQLGSGPDGDCLWIGTDSPVLYQVSTTGREDEVKSIKAVPASHLALGRLDDDQWLDLVFTNQKLIHPADKKTAEAAVSITVLWGSADGFDADRGTGLSIPNAVSTTVGDLDSDGHGDLLVAVYQGDQSRKASSLVFFHNGSRQLPAQGLPVATEGAQGVAIAKLDSQARPVAIFANSLHRTLDDAVPLLLYWGSAGGFSTKAMVEIPNLSGYKSSLSDLNGDGFGDLLVANGADILPPTAARAPDLGVNIYWGGSEGTIRGPGPTRFDPARRQILREPGIASINIASINVADLNGDGFLDVVLGAFEVKGKTDSNVVIYYGSATGLRPEDRKSLHVPDRSLGCPIADFNKDGRLDIAIACFSTNQVITYLGSAGGYSEDNKTILPYPAPVDLEAADLNSDGWLDLLVGSYWDPVANHHNTGLSIFWGSAQGYRQSNSQWLPGLTPIGLGVGDLDGDGHLDIVVPNYHGDETREHLPSYIYWGSPQGYAPLQRTSLTVESAADVTIADFDRDGKLDLAFTAHSVDAGHLGVDSPVYFNDGNRFKAPKIQYLPSVGPHQMWVQDIGNIYTRRNEENFTSRVLAWKESCRSGRIEIDAATPLKSRVSAQVRSAASESALASAPWHDVNNGAFKLPAADRALQYRLALHSANGDAYPIIRKVHVSLQ